MIVRRASEADLPFLVEFSTDILGFTPIGRMLEADPETLEPTCRHVLANGAVFVAEVLEHRRVIGMIGLTLERHTLGGLVYADEVAWWVDPAYRGHLAGPRLLRAAEEWATRNGARAVKIVQPSSSPRMGAFLELQGYRLTETTYLKELDVEQGRSPDADLAHAGAGDPCAENSPTRT